MRETDQENEVDSLDEIDRDEIFRETMSGDLRDIILDRIRNLQKPWQQMTEDEQRSLAFGVDDACQSLIKKMVRTISADGRKVVRANLQQITVKDGIKCVAVVSKHDEERHQIMDFVGSDILLVVSDADEYTGERAPAQIDLDQPDLPVADNCKNIPDQSDEDQLAA